jgi:ElaB/YqjD/DUF883 family membrane-anchored ribosome-binding protein
MKQRLEEIAAGLDRVLEEAETLLTATAEGAEKKLDHTNMKARESLHRICGHLRDARSEVLDGARKVDGAVHSHPWAALAATAAVGFLAGLLVRRR